jgi:DNA-binding HxlR family transcriptional regulator
MHRYKKLARTLCSYAHVELFDEQDIDSRHHNQRETVDTARRLPDTARSACPIACALDTTGDRWSMLVIRDLFLGKSRFKEFVESPEGITPNILTERRQRLENAGIIIRQRYSEHPPRDKYLLTAKGVDQRP